MPHLDNLQYQRDMEFGFKEEIKVKEELEKYFGILKLLEKYSTFDYENEKFLIELKSRRIKHDKYPTAMVNYSKILKTANSKKRRIIVFNYTDGLFYWEVNSEEYEIGKGGRKDRGAEEVYVMAFVKKEYLKPLTSFGLIASLI